MVPLLGLAYTSDELWEGPPAEGPGGLRGGAPAEGPGRGAARRGAWGGPPAPPWATAAAVGWGVGGGGLPPPKCYPR